MWKQTGRKPQPLADQGDCPAELAYVWGWLCELRLPLTYTELMNWQTLTRRHLAAWEVDLLMQLDRIARA